jgi:erythromycin esterase
MTARPLALLLALTLAACGGGGDGPIEPPPPNLEAEAAAWLKANAIPFATPRAGNGFADLQPVKAIVGDARIVSLGEATHGTCEFFEMKHRMFEFLVREMGFTVFAIEAEWAEAARVNEYVQTGRGDAHRLLSGLYFWTWRTPEVLGLIEWMRAYNANPANSRKLSFVGIDAQFPTLAMDTTIAFLGRVDPALAASARENYSCLRPYSNDMTGFTAQRYREVPDSVRLPCLAKVRQVHLDIQANRARIVAATSQADYEFGLRASRLAVQGEAVRAERNYDIRDAYMAENAAWWLEQSGPGARMVIWAHNYHVSTVQPWMGSFLRTQFGSDLRVFGFTFFQGSFTAVNLDGGPFGAYTVGPPPTNSYEHLFHGAGHERFILDLRPAATDPGAGWLKGPLNTREMGCCHRPSVSDYGVHSISFPAAYDAIIHFENSTPTQILDFVL